MIFEKIRTKLQELKGKGCPNDFYWGWNRCIEASIHTINQVQSEYNNGWISVDDRLPEKFDSVLVSCKGSVVGGENAGKCEFVATGYMFSKDHWQIQGHDDVKYIKVIAWQPLPDPYIPKAEPEWQNRIMNHFTKGE